MSQPGKTIYLDNNATTATSPTVAARLNELLQNPIANPASQHRSGRRALSMLERSRDTLFRCLGVPTRGFDQNSVIWTSGGTEANNLAISSLAQSRPGWIVVGAIEHPSVLEAAKLPGLNPDRIRVLPVDSCGNYDLNVLREWTTSTNQLAGVSLMLGNNETGVIQDIRAAADLCRQADIPLHCDVVQAVGKIPVAIDDLGISAVTITAHKIHGPVGIGALVTRGDFKIFPALLGGGQQLGLRAGTEPAWLADGLATALEEMELLRRNGAYESVQRLRDQFESLVSELDDVTVIAKSECRLPHTSNIAFLGLDRQALQMALDLEGIACSTGSACSSGSSRPSHVLMAMNLPVEQVAGSLRFSLSRFTTEEEVVDASEAVKRVVTRLRKTTARSKLVD